MNTHEVFTADGVLRRWVDKRTGEEVENLLKWRKTIGISWSMASDLYPAKVWVYFLDKSVEKNKLWFSFDSDEEAEQAFEKADSLRDAYLRREHEQLRCKEQSRAEQLRCTASPSSYAAKSRAEQLRCTASLEAEDLRLPTLENLGEPPEYDPSDNPF